MDGKQDIITRAFIGALASYQKDHGQECTYDVSCIPDSNATAAVIPQQADQPSTCLDRSEQHDVGMSLRSEMPAQANQPATEHAQGHFVDRPQPTQQQTTLMHISQQHEQHFEGHPDEHQAQECTRRLDGRTQQNYPANTEAAAEGNPDSGWQETSINNQQYDWQQYYHAYPAYDHTYTAAYGGWDGAAAATTAAATTAAAAWDWTGQGYSAMPPPPPPAPPLPPVRLAHTNNHQACRICGKSLSAPLKTEPEVQHMSDRSIAEVMSNLQQHVPVDVAAVPESLQAAKAAMHKAAAVATMQDSASNIPELLMAWFYAGYHAGAQCSSSSSQRCGVAGATGASHAAMYSGAPTASDVDMV